MTLKVRILRYSRRLFIILVSLTMTWFSEKMLISPWCIHGFMSNLIKTPWTDSIHAVTLCIATQLVYLEWPHLPLSAFKKCTSFLRAHGKFSRLSALIAAFFLTFFGFDGKGQKTSEAIFFGFKSPKIF